MIRFWRILIGYHDVALYSIVYGTAVCSWIGIALGKKRTGLLMVMFWFVPKTCWNRIIVSNKIERVTFKYPNTDDIIEGGKTRMAYQGNWLSKTLVIGIIALLIGMSSIPTIASDTASSTTLDNDGSLLGYVNDTSGNPIECALVRVYFHGTYEEDYSDSTGYYHVTNIHICNCTKNTTCSKEG